MTLEEKYKLFKEKGVCPICGYAGKNTRDWESGLPMGHLSHKEFAFQYLGRECLIVLLEEKKLIVPEE